jgi:hypothetical protein
VRVRVRARVRVGVRVRESGHLGVERRAQRLECARRARLVLGAAAHVLLVEPAQLVAQLGLLGAQRG